MAKREIIRKKLRQLRKRKEVSTAKEAGGEEPQFPSPPKGKPLIRIFKEKEYKGGTAVIEPVSGLTNIHIADSEQLKDFLMEQLTKGHYVKIDNLGKTGNFLSRTDRREKLTDGAGKVVVKKAS